MLLNNKMLPFMPGKYHWFHDCSMGYCAQRLFALAHKYRITVGMPVSVLLAAYLCRHYRQVSWITDTSRYFSLLH